MPPLQEDEEIGESDGLWRVALIGVIFDMDGLLLDTQGLAHRALKQAARELGFELSSTHCEAVRGLDEENTVRSFEAELGIEIDAENFLKTFRTFYHKFIEGGPPVKEGAFELLDVLEARGIPKGVATSTERTFAIKKLTGAGIFERFTVVVGGDEVKHGKPAPDIFLLAAERLGIAPESCFVLEDSPAGIVGAAAAGMRPILVPDNGAPTEGMEELSVGVYSSLVPVCRFFEAIDLRV